MGTAAPGCPGERSSSAAGSITNSEEMYSKYNLAGQSLREADSVWNCGLTYVAMCQLRKPRDCRQSCRCDRRVENIQRFELIQDA